MKLKQRVLKNLLLFIAVFTQSSYIFPQINTGFEEPVIFDTINFIPSWNIWLHNASGMIDNSGAYAGKNGLCVEPVDYNKQYSVDAGLHIPSYLFEKDNVSFNLKINSTETEIDSIVFKIAESGYNLYRSTKIDPAGRIETNGWTTYNIPFDKLEANTKQVKYIFRIYAKGGYFKVDDFAVLSNNKILPTDKWRDFDDKIIVEQLKKRIISLDDFISSQALNAQSTIVGLGENSHGIKECKKLRYDIIKEFSKTNNVNVIIEQPPVELSILNNQLRGKSHAQLQKEINQLFYVYRSEYFQKIVQETADNLLANTVSFYGIDIQYENYKKEDLQRIKAILTDKEEQVIDRSIEYFGNYNSPLDRIYHRDSLMAINALSHIEKDRKNVILAHNAHLKNNSYSAGSILDENLGDKYLNIGVLVGKGTHRANDLYEGKNVHPMPPILPESYEYILNRVSAKPFVLDMKQIKSQDKIYSRLCPRVMSTAGAYGEISQSSHIIVDITDEYDYIVYFPTVEAMNLIEYE